MVYYQVLDVVGKSPDHRIASVIPNLVLEIGMHPVGDLEKVVTSTGEMFMQLLRESHIYGYQNFEEGEFILSILSCRSFQPQSVRDYLQRSLGLGGYKMSGYVQE